MNATPSHPTQAYLLTAIANPLLQPDIGHVAAATGRPVIDLSRHFEAGSPADSASVALARHSARAAAVIVDHEGARALAGPRAHDHIFLVVPDDTPIPWEDALASHAEHVFLIPAQAPELLAAVADVEQVSTGAERGTHTSRGREHGRAIAVCGSAGGVGTSTFALALARGLAGRGHTTTVVDAVDCSGGLDLLAGCEHVTGARWPDLHLNMDGRIDAEALRAALPTDKSGVALLTAARAMIAEPFHLTPDLVASVITALKSTGGSVIVDAPPGQLWLRGDIDANPFTRSLDHVVVLTTAQVRPASAAGTLIRRLTAAGVPHSLVVRHRDWSGLEKVDIEKITGLNVDVEIPTVNRLARSAEIAGFSEHLPRELTKAASTLVERMNISR